MRYDQLAQQALRGVVREALLRAAGPQGLPGAHHFYITFKTLDPEADVDDGLAAAYPDEMTVVLEHQFWDLLIEDDFFEVTLKFGGVPKYLKVPYRAVTRFHDPSVGFHLEFDYETPAGGIKPAPKTANPEPGAKDEPIKAKDGEEAGTVVSLDAFRKKDG
ncbi:MAG: ClpXP protease specificity-enhancing factor SspB [Pseudomonadota bacterium]